MRTIYPIIAPLCSARHGDSAADPELTTPVANDSRLVVPGGVFIAVPGHSGKR